MLFGCVRPSWTFGTPYEGDESEVHLSKCDCKVKYVRKGICDLGGMSYKSLYVPKYQTLQYFGYVVKVKHPQMFLFTL
jgi:hypothetical protein